MAWAIFKILSFVSTHLLAGSRHDQNKQPHAAQSEQ